MSAPGPAGTARTGRATTTVTPLPASGPGVGDTLLIERATWTVTSHATYRSEGYHADEWECAKLGTTAYLLKETEGDGVRWFFTISVPAPAVTLPDGTALAPSITRAPEASPPSALHFRGGVYRYETTTDGSYEEAPGRGVAKTTWEYWDAAHAHNLAIERWPAGRIEAYHGAYVDGGTIEVRPSRQRWTGTAAGIMAGALVYFVALLMGLPFDRCTAASLAIAFVVGFARSLYHAPPAAPAAVILAPALGVAFYRFPPLTTVAGLIALVIGPALLARWALRATPVSHAAVRSAAFFTAALPLLALGLYFYFSFAPGPHTFGQYVLALSPAFLGGFAAMIVAGLVLRASE